MYLVFFDVKKKRMRVVSKVTAVPQRRVSFAGVAAVVNGLRRNGETEVRRQRRQGGTLLSS